MNRAASSADVTAQLRAWREQGGAAPDRLVAEVYGNLKRLAASQLRRERSGHTLQTTALVHEVYFRLFGEVPLAFEDRAQFFGLAATMMRRVLVDHARARNARKRRMPDGHEAFEITSAHLPAVDVLDLDRVLSRFAAEFPRQARVVELRYFGDLELEEVAACLAVSPTTVKRDWQFARAWIKTEL